VDEAGEELVTVAPGCAGAAGVDGDCGEACGEPARKRGRKKAKARLSVNFFTASPDGDERNLQ